VNGRYAPPAIAPTLVLGLPPPPEPPLEVEEGIEDAPVPGSGVLAMSVSRLVLDGVSEEVALERETAEVVLERETVEVVLERETVEVILEREIADGAL
jgi:hypothetical protein